MRPDIAAGSRLTSLILLSLALAARPALASVSVTFRQGVSPAGYSGAQDVYLGDGGGTPWDPNTNYNGFTLEADGGQTKNAILMRWDVSAIPSTATVTAVTLTLNVTNGSTATYHLYECLRPWVDSQATWNQYATGLPWSVPGATGAADKGSTTLDLDSLTGATGLRTFRLNASGIAVVQNWVANPTQNHGFAVPAGSVNDGFGWSQTESTTASSRPRLNVTYTSGTTTTLTFQSGVSPSSAYAGASDVIIANGPDPKTLNQDTNGLLVDSSPELDVSLISFDLSSIPPWATVTQAALDFNVTNVSTGPFSLYELLQPWEQNTATWNQYKAGSPWASPGAQGAADHDSTVLGTFQPTALGTQSIALNAAGLSTVQAWISGARANHGFILQNPTNTDGADMNDSEDTSSSTRPGFTVTYTEGQLVLSPTTPSEEPLALTVQRQRLDGTPIDTGAPALDVTLATTSSTGGFSTSNLPNATTTPTLTVQIPAGASQSPTVYFSDPTSGTSTVTASAAAAWTGGFRSVVVLPPDAGADAGAEDGGASDGGELPDAGTDAGEPPDAGTISDAGEPPDAGSPSIQLNVGCGASGGTPALGLLALGLLATAPWLRRRRR